MAAEVKGNHVRCLKCLKIIECSRYDTSNLVSHVKNDHPEIIKIANDKVRKLYQLAAENGVSQERLSQISKATGLTEEQMADKAELYLSKHRGSSGKSEICPNDSEMITKRQCYRKSIQKWTPTDGCIYCPNCCNKRPPLIKSSGQNNNNCCGACVSSCWPFCFLPCLLPSDNKEYLYCHQCNAFLGLYDRENNCIKPNREFVPCKEEPKNCCG